MMVPNCILKCIELMLAIACLTLHQFSYDLTNLPTLMLCSGTYIGFIIVFSGEIVGEVVSAAADAYVDAWWSASGGALFGACGWMTLLGWQDVPASTRRGHAQAAAVCSLVCAAVLIIDALLLICSSNREDCSTRSPDKRTEPGMMLAIACLTLHQFSYDLTNLPTLMLCSGTFVGFVIVFSGEIMGEILFAPVDLIQDIYYGLVGMVMYAVCGGMIIKNRLQEADMQCTGDFNGALLTGSLSIVQAVFLFLDLCLTYEDYEEYDDDPWAKHVE